MKPSIPLVVLVPALAAVLAGCSTVNSRIKDHQAAYDASPPSVQDKIRKGQVDVGFTQEQAAMALGRPDRIVTRKTASGERQTWIYGGNRARVGMGFGFGSWGGGPVAMGTSVGVEEPVGEYDPRMRVTFEQGQVVSVENRH